MIVVMIVPTGVGASIGGDAGDATPASKLLASCCDILITHPNVVNASDINEMTDNTWYVEGSMLDQFLLGKLGLYRRDVPNRILVIGNPPLSNETVNAVSAARATIGAEIEIIELSEPLVMRIKFEKGGRASGEIEGVESALKDVALCNFDALAVHTPIESSREISLQYFREGGVNPWGGVEAMLSKVMSRKLMRPVVHAPLENVGDDDKELFMIYREKVRPRIAAEAVSICYFHCVLKGLHRAPQVIIGRPGISNREVSFMVSPYGCWGPPHEACQLENIPIVFVKENRVVTSQYYDNWSRFHNGSSICVENYLEAAGVIMAGNAGVSLSSVRQSFPETSVSRAGDRVWT